MKYKALFQKANRSDATEEPHRHARHDNGFCRSQRRGDRNLIRHYEERAKVASADRHGDCNHEEHGNVPEQVSVATLCSKRLA